jgi:hypothetical protein
VKPLIAPQKLPELLRLVASISALLGPVWKLNIDDAEGWDQVRHVSWHPDFASGKYPVAVDFYNSTADDTDTTDHCTVQVFDLSIPGDDPDPPEIVSKVNEVIAWCVHHNIPHGTDQA